MVVISCRWDRAAWSESTPGPSTGHTWKPRPPSPNTQQVYIVNYQSTDDQLAYDQKAPILIGGFPTHVFPAVISE